MFARGLMIGLCMAATWAGPAVAGVVSEPVTYQGKLVRGGAPVNDMCDFQFSLWNAQADGNQVGVQISKFDVGVVQGLFQVELGVAPEWFDGGDRWLQVAVMCDGDGGRLFQTLSPREHITFAPYALQTRGMFVSSSLDVGIGTSQPMYDVHLQTSGSILGGTTRATAGIQNSFLSGLEFVHRWFDISVGGDIEMSMHSGANLTLGRSSAQGGFPSIDLSLSSNGNVGIGVETAEELIDARTSDSRAFLQLVAGSDFGEAGVSLCSTDGFSDPVCSYMQKDGTILEIRNPFTNIRFGSPTQTVLSLDSNSVDVGSDADRVDLDVSGDLIVDGDADIGYVQVDSGWTAGNTTVTVVCPANTTVVGGGCETEGNDDRVKRTYPGSDAGWICTFEIAASNHRAHAICARVK